MGFELDRFQGDVDEELVCPICSGVLEDPLQVQLFSVNNDFLIEFFFRHLFVNTRFVNHALQNGFPDNLLAQ